MRFRRASQKTADYYKKGSVMKRLLSIGFLVAVWTCSVNVRADCVQPRPSVALPDGATASRDQILEAMKALKTYDSAVTAYADCLSSEATFQIAAVGGADVAPNRVTEIRAIEAR